MILLNDSNKQIDIPIHFLNQWNKYKNIITKGHYVTAAKKSKQQEFLVYITVDREDFLDLKVDTSERYTLQVTAESIKVKTENYYGFLRALETLSQVIDTKNFIIEKVPIQIEDEPNFSHRGIMIDTARHYLSVQTILRTIDAMQYNKLNVLHWHITDDESFPLELINEPEITSAGAFHKDKIYSIQDVQSILNHAKAAGVRVIPEVDSPSHTRSWGLSDKYASTMIVCPGAEHYNGQLDVTLDLTLELVGSVVKDTQTLFNDDYIHLGGDEVIYSCYDKRPSIKAFMEKEGIENYVELQVDYRNKQKKMLKSNKKPIFWTNEKLNIPPGPTEILQYWGDYENIGMLKDIPNKIILSPDNMLYINTGLGFVFGNDFGTYFTWEVVYDFDPQPSQIPKSRVLGAEATLWSELNNDYTIDNYLWIRSSALAERLWSNEKDSKINVVKRLVQMQNLLVDRGIEASPVTSQFCSINPEKCFS